MSIAYNMGKQQDATKTIKAITYKKRIGTSGIRGQLYETKLISLIYFRAKYDDNVKELHLATNMDEMGTFDDICFKVKLKGFDKPLAVFLQAKHREGDKVLTLNSKNDLAKYFDSYVNIRRSFSPSNKDVLFKGEFDQTECLFIMYTTAKDDLNNTLFEKPIASNLNSLIGTGDAGLQPCYKDEDVEFLSEIILKEQLATLASQMAAFLSEETDNMLSMNDELMLQYHVILVQRVVDVSEIQRRNEEEEHRIATFRQDFFETNEEFIRVFKDTLYKEILKKRKLQENEITNLMTTFFNKTSDVTILSKLIENIITYKNGRLEFVVKMPEDLKRQLNKVNIPQSTIDAAMEMGAKEKLESREFKVPTMFGNKDLTIRGKIDVNVENKLTDLTMKFVDLLNNSKSGNIVTIDEHLGDAFLQLNGGIASAVGNILVFDKNTKLMKFSDNFDLVGDLAKRLFKKLQGKFQNLDEYRFDVKVKKFPKVSLEMIEYDENTEILNGQLTTLANQMALFLSEETNSIMSMNDELLLRYHVVLGQKVIKVSEIQRRNEDEEHRIASFRQDFFETNEEFIVVFKDTLCKEILKKRKLEENEITELLSKFFNETSDISVLSKLIGNVCTYENGKLKFIANMSEDLKGKLNVVTVTQSTVDKAFELAAREKIESLIFKVPAAFGNKDLTIRGEKGVKIERRLNHLHLKISELIKNAAPRITVIIDESLGDDFLELDGGIAGAIGNILVLDENTKLIKFTDNYESLGEHAKRLFTGLQSKVQNLYQFRFDVKVKTLPKLSFDIGHDENVDMLRVQIRALAEEMATLLSKDTDSVMSMNNELMLRYHVILAQKVFDVSEIQNLSDYKEHRIAKFRKDFFDTTEELLRLFKDTLFIGILKKRNLEETELNNLLLAFFNENSNVTILSKLIGNIVRYKKGKLEFVTSVSEDFQKQIDTVNVDQSFVDKALDLAAREILISRQFKVPAAYGNKDLIVTEQQDMKIDIKFNNLQLKIVDLLNNSVPKIIITIDESLEDRFRQLSCGIVSAVGNILVFDENTKLLKFTDNLELLGDLANCLFAKLQSEIPKLDDYRFDIKIKNVPILSLKNKEHDDEDNVLKDQFTALANQIATYLSEECDSIMSMDDELMLRYHVILVEKVIDVSDIQLRNEVGEHRIGSFRHDFFDTNEECILVFKETLIKEVLKNRKLENTDISDLLSSFFNDTSNITLLSKLIGNVIIYENGKLVFASHMSDVLKNRLNEVHVDQWTVDEAMELAAKEILISRRFKVPIAYGNRDLTLSNENGSNTERDLNSLQWTITNLLTKSRLKTVAIDESLGDGLLKLSGGIAGIVGNILVPDPSSKLMKLTDDRKSLQDLSKRLFEKLQNGIKNLHEFRFDVKVKKFPKLSFVSGDHDVHLVKDFLSKLLFYTNQADENGVEEILKSEIEDHQCNTVNNFRVKSDAIFLNYHDAIQKWWMAPKEGTYLTKKSTFYEDAIRNIVNKPLTTVASMSYMLKIKNNVDCIFHENAVNTLKLQDQPPGTIILTESSALTVTKVIQYLKNKDYAVLDLEYILNLPANDYNLLRTELMNTNKENKLIVVCNVIQNTRIWCKRLENIAKAVNDKNTVIISNKISFELIKKYFVQTDNVVNDNRSSIIDMVTKSQESILQNAQIIFQGEEACIVDDESMTYIEGEVLNKIIHNETITIGKPIGNLNYDKLKHLYTDRRVKCVQNQTLNERRTSGGKFLVTFYDIEDTVALITAKPGMGKSTLLTHLSYKTKELDPKVWIVRINLLDYSKEFKRWQRDKIVINKLEVLNFICRIILNEKHSNEESLTLVLEESNDVVYLKDCTGDECTIFELKMFLHYFNRRNLIFLFDGFDEISPHYTREAIALLKHVKNNLQKHRMWITSRSYEKVKSILEQEFGASYEILHFSGTEQDEYLYKFWKSKIIFRELNIDQFNNICHFMEFMSSHYYKVDITKPVTTQKNVKKEKHQMVFIKVCLNFLGYLKKEISVCPESVINTFNLLFSGCNHVIQFFEDFDTPLHLYLTAEYFQNKIKEVNRKTNKWNLDINAITIYQQFFETKLKKIRFEEKNKIDLHNPDNIMIYEKIREDFFAKHKKLGAYAVFYQNADKIFNVNELTEIRDLLDKIKNGREKTGLIHSVVNNIPTFIHMTFTEYFAVEYICDLLKTENSEEKQKSFWDFILNVMFLECDVNVRNLLGYKIKMDEALRMGVKRNGEIIFDLLLTQGKGVFTYYADDFSKELYLKIKLSLNKAMANDCHDFVSLLYILKMKLTEDYLKDQSRTTSRIKRLKFYHSLNKKRTALD